MGILNTSANVRMRGNRAKHIARVAAEYTQLLYHVSRTRTEPCAFIDESQWVCEPFSITVTLPH